MKEREGRRCCELTMFQQLFILLALLSTRAYGQRQDIRLVGGSNNQEGRVEILINEVWGTVCDDLWDLDDAHVACGQLGLGPAIEAGTATLMDFGRGTGSIFLDDLDCDGDEASLVSCSHHGVDNHNCGHTEDAAVRCQAAGVTPTESRPDIRLVGDTHLQGRVEILVDGEWGTICDDLWDMSDARVACRQLGLGEPVEVRPFEPGSGLILLDNLVCDGTESSLLSCSHGGLNIHNCVHSEDAGVVCAGVDRSAGIRLVDGSSQFEGRIEVLVDNRWGTVCNDEWDDADANVACRQLGFGPAADPLRSFGPGTGPIHLDDLRCDGDEPLLTLCEHNPNHNCAHYEDAGIVCRESGESTIRLVGGSTPYEGRVEVLVDNEWGTVCDDEWDMSDAEVACRQLGLGPPTSAPVRARFGAGSGPIHLDNLQCDGSEALLTSCPHISRHNCIHQEDAGLVCSPQAQLATPPPPVTIRLVGGSHPLEGRVEVFMDNQWGTVCDDEWNLPDANVVCRQLGYGAAETAQLRARYGAGTGPIHLDDVRCSGNEETLTSCPHTSFHNCAHEEDAGVICRPAEVAISCPTLEVPLHGRLNCLRDAQPNPVCLTQCNEGYQRYGESRSLSCLPSGNWDAEPLRCEARPILECPSGGFLCNSNRLCVPSDWRCNGNRDCPLGEDEEQCDAPPVAIRLVGGPNQYEGRVEIFLNNQWGTVCDDQWNLVDANVACRQLGFGPALAVRFRARYGAGTGPIHLDDVRCTGEEETLPSCFYISSHNCAHDEDAGVICNPPAGSCSRGQFRCQDGSCIPSAWRCDGKQDCGTEEDEDNCHSGNCTNGCVHGACVGPDMCSCEDGYQGPSCEDCVPFEGCVHGTCENPGDCICLPGWGGLFCDTDLVRRCPVVVAPPHGNLTCTEDRVIGSVCTLQCEEGYRVQGPSDISCLETGEWDTLPPQCEQLVRRCPAVNAPLRGNLTCTEDRVIGSVCTLQCEQGYRVRGPSNIFCLETGQWDTMLPHCNRIRCPPLEQPAHGELMCPSGNMRNVFDAVCTVVCDEGYTRQGQRNSVRCLETGQWDSTVECEIERCDVLPPLPLGSMKCTQDNVFGSTCVFACDDGFQLNGPSSRECDAFGSWSQYQPVCEAVRCPPVLPPSFGMMTCTNGAGLGSVCTSRCGFGHRLIGTNVTECVAEGRWTNDLPNCTVITCPPLEEIPTNGQLACTMGGLYGSLCKYTCDRGFTVHPPAASLRQCLADGWTGEVPECRDTMKPVFPSCPVALFYVSDKLQETAVAFWQNPVATDNSGETIRVEHVAGPLPGDSLAGGSHVVDYEAKDSSGNTAFCNFTIFVRVIRCAELSSSDSMSISCSHGNLLDSVCTFSCERPGSSLVGVESVQCVYENENTRWSNPLPSCTGLQRPVFRDCPMSQVVVASNNSESAVVTWAPPIATDNTLNVIPAVLVIGQGPESEFDEGLHIVVYKARDASENLAWCNFTITVQVIRCPSLPQPDVGAIECTGQVLGSVCTKVCPDRYGLLSGPSTVECLRNEDMGMWSNQLPDCVDDSPPILTPLPPSRRVFAEPLQTSVTVDWEPPRVEGETEEITVVHEAGPAPNSDLEEGVHWVSYYAEDSAGNVAKHTFNITVIVVRCPELEVTGNPRVDCSHGNLLGSSCSADCLYFSNLVGSSVLECLSDGRTEVGSWSASLPSCQIQTCPALDVPPFATMSECPAGEVESHEFGISCKFTCLEGYFGVGEPRKVCRADGWSSTDFRCQRLPCMPLQQTAGLIIFPDDCVTAPVYGTVCGVQCRRSGFSLLREDLTETRCTADGTWEHSLEEFSCHDVAAPVIEYCPASTTVSITEKWGVEVTFRQPIARDNSQGDLRMVTSPPDVATPYNITQDTQFSFTFYDEANNSAECRFDVFAKYELPADILLCPNDTVIETLESTLNVSWERPLFEGEDRENIVVSANVNTTWKVLQLGTHVIEYIAVNTHSGEETVCSFNITLEPPHCPTLEPPHNGALSCRRWPRGEFCSLSCDDGYDVPRLPSEEAPPSMYSCMNSKEWQPHSNVPDCSEERNRRRSNLPAEMYHTGDCADVSTQEQIALALMTIFRSSDSGSICEENDAECSINHVSVTCGSQDAFRELPPTRLNKRSAFTSGRLASMCPPSQRGEMTRKNVTRISFNIGLEDGMSAAANGDVDLSELREQLDSAAQNMASRFVDVLSSTLEDLLTGSRDIDSRLMEWLCEPVVQFGEVEIECDDGFVRQATSSLKCVACPRGFYSAGSECMPCAQGFYQDKPAQTSCEPCPPGQSTSRTGSKTMDSCTDKCPPGHFSPTGLVPCFPCSRLSYQSREGQRSCDPCPAHHLTNSHGAVSVKECRP